MMDQLTTLILIILLTFSVLSLFMFNKDGFNYFGKFIISLASWIIIFSFILIIYYIKKLSPILDLIHQFM